MRRILGDFNGTRADFSGFWYSMFMFDGPCGSFLFSNCEKVFHVLTTTCSGQPY